MTTPRPDLERELEGLKDFQLRTVDRVHERLWDPVDPTRRFLVADEVGLGKTLVARGVIAKAIDHLWDTVDRVDVVYICSNGQIARQNLPKLRVGSDGDERHHADRLTLLATELRKLEGRKLNFVSFTPGTSFNISDSGGHVGERVLLYWLLKAAWSSEVRPGPWVRFFQGRVSDANFDRALKSFDRRQLTAELGREFAESLDSLKGPMGGRLSDELRACVREFVPVRGNPGGSLGHRRYRLIGKMRQALARTAVRKLEPDLVILDEFQRFQDLMSDEGEGAELARELFDFEGCRLLLLSATPFKMYTLPEEPEGDDHYRDFVDTVSFLAGPDRAARVQHESGEFRRALYAGDLATARAARDQVQAELRRVMTRTERLATTPDRDGFVVTRRLPGVALASDDVRDFRRLQSVAKVVNGQDPLEYWRAAPYVLELMENYQIKHRFQDHDPGDPALVSALSAGAAGLTWEQVRGYQRVDPANAKMRGLAADVLDRGAWQLVWIPPSLPYYELAGPYAEPQLREFTKRLVFSSWAVAPKAIGTVISYEAERRIAERAARASSAAAWTQYDATRPTGLLTFQKTDGRLTGVPALGLLYPSVTLAEAGDPLDVARTLGRALPMARSEVEAEVRRRVEELLATLPAGPETGVEDARWYWAAALLDRQRDLDLMAELPYGLADDPDDVTQRGFGDHLDAAAELEDRSLGRRPDDLVEVLVLQALGGPGNVALRALSRVTGGAEALSDPDIRSYASCIAWSLRNLFNRPEIMGIVRSSGEGAYWLDVLRHSVNGGLQSVLDEYVHVMNVTSAETIAEEVDAAASLRTAVQTFTDIQVRNGRVDSTPHRTRTHLAVRFGRGVTEDDKSVMREGQVRTAFNSPFWPFVLASTSVGQEGLDFHHYSHAIVHWNLPSNPVDLEQREGRVHRFQGHAVRRNVAAGYGARPEVIRAANPWAELFRLAAEDREPGVSDIYPSWIPPLAGTARIERYVPALPLSKESHALRRLLRTVGAYRLVLGQPRQEDLLRYLGDSAADLDDLRIDLEPR